MTIKAIATTYRGTRFRSKLESSWAATFDQLGWAWQYEPEGVDLGDGVRYLCDFRLPEQHTWVEVKSPANDRIEKTYALQQATSDLVVICRPAGPGNLADWHGTETTNVGIFTCRLCHKQSFKIPTRPRGNLKPLGDCGCPCCGFPSLDPSTRISSSSSIETVRRRQEEVGLAHTGRPGKGDEFLDDFHITGLPFAQIPKRGAP